ncbi:GNAT family N-acetyltransferase [Thalassobaculum sp.]|uniref:GNAT family N-acetyltransferase n=1 Tax=Thalassobaculum sp. TaxID=2022740 RepID=UPI0032EAC934
MTQPAAGAASETALDAVWRDTDGLLIRPAAEDDLPAVVAMLADDGLGKSRERPESPLPAAYGEAFRRMALQGGNLILVAELNGAVVGCLQLTLIHGISRMGATRAQVEGVRVATAARGRRVGERLMRAATVRAKANGAVLMQLTTDHRRIDAHRFYERLGFVGSHLGMKKELG